MISMGRGTITVNNETFRITQRKRGYFNKVLFTGHAAGSPVFYLSPDDTGDKEVWTMLQELETAPRMEKLGYWADKTVYRTIRYSPPLPAHVKAGKLLDELALQEQLRALGDGHYSDIAASYLGTTLEEVSDPKVQQVIDLLGRNAVMELACACGNASNYRMLCEFPKRNLASHPSGHIIWLDVFYHRRMK